MDGQECDFEAMQRRAETTRIEPGLGVYLPSFVPHWVETEAGVSISFSIPFHTPYVERGAAVMRHQQANAAAASLPAADRRFGARRQDEGALVRSLERLRGSYGE